MTLVLRNSRAIVLEGHRHDLVHSNQTQGEAFLCRADILLAQGLPTQSLAQLTAHVKVALI